MQAREVRKPYALKGLSSSPLWNWLLLPCSLCHQQPRTAQKHIFQTENCCAPLAHRIISKCVVCNCYHLGDSSKLICPSAVSENSNLDFCFTDILLTRRRPFQGLELVSQSKVSYTLDPEPSENDRWPRMKKKEKKPSRSGLLPCCSLFSVVLYLLEEPGLIFPSLLYFSLAFQVFFCQEAFL